MTAEPRVALVTGASRGIGLAIVRRLRAEGFVVVGCARDGAALDGALRGLGGGGRAWGRACDVSSEGDVASLFAEVVAREGRLDVLVNNAGIFERAEIERAGADHFDRVMAVNARSVFLCCREAFRVMAGKGGDIVNVSSLGGVKNTEKFPGTSAYVASKYAVAGLTEALAAEGKAKGIRVKAVSPGAIDTAMNASSGNDLRAGMSAEELAGVVAFLVSEAGRGLSGTNLEIYSNG